MAVGVAISGGGHRATLWGWGALLGIAELGLHRDVVSIASVSGGSIASGAVAAGGDYSSMTPDELEAVIAPGIRVTAREGLFFFGPPTDGYVTSFFGVAGLAVGSLVALLVAAAATGSDWAPLPFLAVGLLTVAAAWIVWLRKGKVPPLPSAVLTAALALAGPLASGFVWAVGAERGWHPALGFGAAAVITFAFAGLALVVFGRRSVVVDRAMGRTLLAGTGAGRGGGGGVRLRDIDGAVHHVFCATDLQSGDQLYLTPRLVYGYRIGRGMPGELPLSTAVQCSACLPGAFVARELETRMFGLRRPWPVRDGEPAEPPRLLVLNDGGVYDNMADQWEQGYASRRRRLDDLERLQPRADVLVVVNASKALGWKPLKRATGIAAEIRGLTRSVDILYDVSTSHRRQGLVTRFASAGPDELDGCLVHISQSPYSVPNAFLDSIDNAVAGRAEEALTLLESLGVEEEEWEARARRSSAVPTVLSAVGEDVAAGLLEHAFLLAAINIYVILGLGVLPDAERCRSARFARLAST